MPKIDVSGEDHRALGAIAALLGTDRAGAVHRLLSWANSAADSPLAQEGRDDAEEGEDTGDGKAVAVYAEYKGHRVKGSLDPVTGQTTITSAPWNGAAFTSPSGAGGAVIAHVSPERARDGEGRRTSPPCNGWVFWRVSRTGLPSGSLRPGRSEERRE